MRLVLWSAPNTYGSYQLRTNYRAKQAGVDDEIGGVAGVASVAMMIVWIANTSAFSLYSIGGILIAYHCYGHSANAESPVL